MITAIPGPLVVEPDVWVLVFNRVASKRWTSWIALGKYKHVRAYAYVPFLHVWVFYDPRFRGTSITIAADGAQHALIREWITDADLMRMLRRTHETRRFPVFGWCVPAIKRLIGLRCSALRPDSLWRSCLRNGGFPFEDHNGRSTIIDNPDPPGILGDPAGPAGASSGDHGRVHAAPA